MAVPERVLNVAEGSPMLIKYAALLLGLMAVMLFAVRPAVRQVGAALALRGPGRAAGHELAGTAVSSTALNSPAPAELDPERQRSQMIHDQVTEHLKREPTQSSRLLQSWIHSD